MRRMLLVTALVVFAATLFLITNRKNPEPASTVPPADTIPAGIVVTETSTLVPPPPQSGGNAPGDKALTEYAKSGDPRNDLEILSNTLANFLTISKQAHTRPLSANEEWSAALRGKRPGADPWISDQHPILDPQKRLIDRWGSPLHFHALGGQKWEIRSAGPDRRIWTGDDLIETLPRSSGGR